MASLNTTSDKGGDDATATAVTIGGSVTTADVVEVCADYDTVQVSCTTISGSLTNVSIDLSGTSTKGGKVFDYRVTLNSSAGGKTIQLTVVSMTAATAAGTPGVTLPQSTATVNIAGASTPPAIDTPTFTSVLSNGATLGGNITDLGTSPTANQHGTVWNYTGNPTTADNPSTLGTPSLGTFTDARTGMQTADQIFFKAYVSQSGTPYYTAESSFHTYPANDPTGFSIDLVTTTGMRINWTDSTESGDAGGSIVIVSEVDGTIPAPPDGTEYTGDASYPFSTLVNGNDYVVFRGQGGGSVTLADLPADTQFWVAVYSYSGTGTGTSGTRYKATTATTGTATTDPINVPGLSTPVLVGGLTGVTSSAATLGATQTDNGGANVTARGIVWNTTGAPTTADNTAQLQTGANLVNEAFSGSVDLTGNAGTQIYFRGYATNSAGTGYTPTAGTVWTEPANQPTGISLTQGSTTLDISWSDPGGATASEGAIVVVKAAADPSGDVPADGTPYSANADWNLAGALGTAKVVFQGPGNSVSVTNLNPDTLYYVRIYEYAGSGTGDTGINFLEEAPLAGNQQTDPLPVPVLTNPVLVGGLTGVTATQADLGATQTDKGGSNVTERGIVWNTTGTPTTADAKFIIQTGPNLGNQSFSGTVTPLDSATEIHFRGYAINSVGTGYTPTEGTVWTEPASQPTGISITPGGSNLDISWSAPGATEGTIVVMDTADPGDPSEVPVDGNEHAASNDWNAVGTGIGTGTAKVVYRGAGSSVNVINLTSSTTYFVRIYRYAGSGTGETGVNYLEETPLQGSDTPTAASVAPTVTSAALQTALTAVTSTAADLGANQTDPGTPADVTERGIVWNLAGSPTVADTKFILESGSNLTGAFNGVVTGLSAGRRIYFEGYAYNGQYGYSSTATWVYTEPAAQPNANLNVTPGDQTLTITWDDPAGGQTVDQGAIIVMREGAVTSDVPADGSDSSVYSPSSVWGSAGALGASKVVFMGSGNSVTVTGLTNDATYYFAIYEYTGAGTGVTGINYLEESPYTGSGTPAPPPLQQASNLWFHNIGTTAMTLFWTAAPGSDGSIVVMQANDPVTGQPTDGQEPAADSQFGLGADLDTNDYVVYRGAGSSVHVTGLSQEVTYHVAVYAYYGSGVSVQYAIPDPAIGNETTLAHTPHNVAILNVDDTVNCTSGCHGGAHSSTGALVARGTDQETLCITCHNPDSLFDSAAKGLVNFSLHTNSKNSPPATPDQPVAGLVDCGSCHELHNYGTSSTHPVNGGAPQPNLHYIRANADKYVPDALTSDMVLHNDTASADWAIPGTSYQGMCQVCHTLTSLGYTNDGSGQETSHQSGDDDCRGCHTHGTPQGNGGFGGAGGSCTGCHSSEKGSAGTPPKRVRRVVTTEFGGGSIASSHLPVGDPANLDASDCEVCHNHTSGSAHKAGKVNLYNADTGAAIELSPYANPATASFVQTDLDNLTTFCLACHDSNGATNTFNPAATAKRPFTTTLTDVVDIATNKTNRAHTNGSATCFGDGNTGCHGTGHGELKKALLTPPGTGPGASPDFTNENETLCLTCHDGGTPVLTPAAPNILADLDGSFAVSTYKIVADSNAPVNQNHDILPADKDWNFANSDSKAPIRPQLTCADCHMPPHNAVATDPVIQDPDVAGTAYVRTYAPTNSYSGGIYSFAYGGGGDPVNPVGCDPNAAGNAAQSAQDWIAANCETVPGRSELDYVDFCLTCHDGNVPAGVVMSHGILPIAGTYSSEYHGAGAQSKYGADTNRGGMKKPWVTDADYNSGYDPPGQHAPLQCTTCHGPHGSPNLYNLRNSITVAGVQMQVGGEGSGFSGISGTTYSLPNQTLPRYWGAWCTFCHRLGGHSYGEGQQCRTGHMHGGSNF